jgi:hypothetical protein
MSDSATNPPELNPLLLAFKSLPRARMTSGAPDDKEWKRGPAFPQDQFFTEWFRNRGRIYYFLFRKNHRVTNIQVAELLALLRTYRRGGSGELQFLSVAGFKEAVARIVESFEQSGQNDFSRYEFVATQYYDAIKNTAALDVMFGSCLLYLPPGIDINLETICSRSGYVHSCGRCVYVRNIYKATKKEMFRIVRSYLETLDKRCFLRPYSHEDFTKHDRDQGDDLMSGLDDVKIYADKYFLESDRLSAVVEEMRMEFQDKIVIPARGPYKYDDGAIKKEVERGDFDRSHSLFMIMDHSLDQKQKAKGDRHFIILYDQLCINESPFQIFDENKPAWVDHTTMPQTLAGAMINITRPYWPANGRVKISDCFIGSGTTWLEAIKHDDVDCSGSDIEPISRLLLEDNLHFFSATTDQVNKYSWSLKQINNSFHKEQEQSAAEHQAWHQTPHCQAYEDAQDLVERLEKREGEFPLFTEEFVNDLRENYDHLTRLLFYTILKAQKRYEAAIQAKSLSKRAALVFEIVALTQQLGRLSTLRELAGIPLETDKHRIKFQGKYSIALTVSDSYLRDLGTHAGSVVEIADCTKKEANRTFDVIVTDPPYGFNTNEDRKYLATVYSSALRMMIGSLKDGGQLVIAVPDWSHTGRPLPAFALREFVTHQILVIAEGLGKEIIHSANQVPTAVAAPPYYWESEKALRRAILHFRFRDLPAYKRHVNDYYSTSDKTSSGGYN